MIYIYIYQQLKIVKPNTTIGANSWKHIWYILGHTRQSKAKQDKTRRRVASARQDKKDKGYPLVLKITVCRLLIAAYDIFDQIFYLKYQQTRFI